MTENEHQTILKILQNYIQVSLFPKTSIFGSIFWAGLILYLLDYIHNKITMPPVEKITGFFNLAALRLKFFESGPIPYAILFVFIFGLLYLILKVYFNMSYPFNVASMYDSSVIEAANRGDNQGVRKELFKLIEKGIFAQGYYSSRLAKLLFRWERDRDLGAVISLKNEIMENDEEDIALAFIPVTLVEWTLPLLGFLGTVIGIGGAIGGIQQGVDILFATNKLSPDVFDKFKSGFQCMALAFDTTFQGLMGLIIVGILHTLLKRSLAKKLANAKSIFTNIVSGWIQGSSNEPVITAISTLSNELEKKIERFTNVAEHVIKKANELRWLKNILYEPVVEFALDDIIKSSNLFNYISEAIKTRNWEFTSLNSTLNTSTCIVGIQVKDNTNSRYLVSFDLVNLQESVEKKQISILPINYLFSEIFQSRTPNLFIGKHESNLVEISYQQKQDGIIQAPTEAILNLKNKLTGEDRIFQIIIDDKEMLLIISKIETGFMFSFYKFETENDYKSPEFDFQLPSEYDFQLNKLYMDRVSNILIAPCILKKNTQKRVYLMQIRTILEKRENNQDEILEQFFNLSNDLSPKQLVSFTKGIILILHEDGNLYYWNKEHQVRTIKDTQASWIKNINSRIIHGSEGRFALATTDKLFMWEVSNDGYIYPYEQKKEGLEIGAIKNNSTLLGTNDGRFIVGYSSSMITVWRFHQYIVDSIS